MSAVRQVANDLDALDDNWLPIGFVASVILANITDVETRTDFEAMAAVEGGPVQTVDVPGAGGDA